MPAGARGHYKIQCNARWHENWPKRVPAIHSAVTLRIVTQLRIHTECSSVGKCNQHEIPSMLKKKITKIDAFLPLKLKYLELQSLIATYVAIETTGQVGVKVRVKAKVGIRK